MKFSEMPYTRVDDKKVLSGLKELKKKIADVKTKEEAFEVHRKFYELSNEFQSDLTIASIRHTIDVTDKFYADEKTYNDSIEPAIENAVIDYYNALYASPHREYLEEKIGKVAFKNIELRAKSISEEILPLMQEENTLKFNYGKLIATAKIDFDGKELNLSLLQPYLVNKDREIRKQAYEKMGHFFNQNAEELDKIYADLIENRTKQAKALGFDNFTPLGYIRMGRNSYGREEIEKLRAYVKKYLVPLADKIHENRRLRLGLDKLSYVDNGVYFKEGDPVPYGTDEEKLELGAKLYKDLSSETDEFYSFMRKNELFDVVGRKTKRAGGYMTYIPRYKSPFIFANFNETSHDVDVITHECGHAFQGYYVADDEIIEHNDITMETAEIHSMSMEFFTEKYADLFFKDRGNDYRKQHLEDSICFIPYGCMVDEFQHIVYDNPDMTPEDRKKVWLDLERQYRPHINYDDDSFFSKGGIWQKQQHIFAMPFYYIDYVLAQLCALQYFIIMKNDFKGAFSDYLNLCKLSAKCFYEDMIAKTKLKVPYADGTIENLVKDLEKLV